MLGYDRTSGNIQANNSRVVCICTVWIGCAGTAGKWPLCAQTDPEMAIEQCKPTHIGSKLEGVLDNPGPRDILAQGEYLLRRRLRTKKPLAVPQRGVRLMQSSADNLVTFNVKQRATGGKLSIACARSERCGNQTVTPATQAIQMYFVAVIADIRKTPIESWLTKLIIENRNCVYFVGACAHCKNFTIAIHK